MHFSQDDKFLPHELSEVTLKEIQAQLQKVRGLSEAFLVRKVLEGSNLVYVLAVLAGYSWNEGVSGNISNRYSQTCLKSPAFRRRS